MVHVRDAATHASIAGALVATRQDDDDDRPFAASWIADDAGDAKLTGQWPHALALEISARGYATASTWVSTADHRGPRLDVDVPLQRGALLSGIVRDPDNTAVADAHVSVRPLDGDDARAIEVTSDARGAWQIDAVAAGRYAATAHSATFAPVIPSAFTLDGITPRRDLVVRVGGGTSCTGTVADAGGTPLAEMKIVVQQRSRSLTARTKTDVHGAFVVGGLPDGTYHLWAYSDEHGSRDLHGIAVKRGTPCTIAVTFEGDDISGTVVDATGEPVAGAHVISDRYDVDISDAAGHFRLRGVAPGDHRLWAPLGRSEGVPPADATAVPAGAHDLRLVARPPATLTGRVWIDGVPARVFGIRVERGEDSAHDAVTFHTADGRFSTAELPAGTRTLVIAAAGARALRREHVELVTGQTRDLGDITLARGRQITGHVRDTAGRAVAGARVVVGYDDSSALLPDVFSGNAVTTTDATGLYTLEIDDHSASPIALHATRADLGRTDYHVLGAADDTVDLTFRITGGIDGVVDGYTGDAMYLDFTGSASRESTSVDVTGAFHLDLPPDTYRISQDLYDSEAVGIAPATVTVIANQRTTVHVGFPPVTVSLVVRGSAKSLAWLYTVDMRAFIVGLHLDDHGEGRATMQPGDYTLCGRDACAPITIAPSPAVQTFDVPPAP